MALADLLAEIDRQGGVGRTRPAVPLELYFEGNHDEASMGCNLGNHPGIATFYEVLAGIRDRPDVHDVLVGITEVMSEPEWPFSDHIHVITTAAPAEVVAWAERLQPDSKGSDEQADEDIERWLDRVQPQLGEVPDGARVVLLFWD
jgi:hypothetical protein